MAEGEFKAAVLDEHTIVVKFFPQNIIEIVATVDRLFSNLNERLRSGDFEIVNIDGSYKIIKRPNEMTIEILGTILPNNRQEPQPHPPAKAALRNLRDDLWKGKLEIVNFDGNDVVIRRIGSCFIEFAANIAFSDLYHHLPHTVQSKSTLRQHILNDRLEVGELNGKCIIMERQRSNENIILIMAEIIPITHDESHVVLNSRLGKSATSPSAVFIEVNVESSASSIDSESFSGPDGGVGSSQPIAEKITASSSTISVAQGNASSSASIIDGESSFASDGSAGSLHTIAEKMTASPSAFSFAQGNSSSVIDGENSFASDGNAGSSQPIAENTAHDKENNVLEKCAAEILLSLGTAGKNPLSILYNGIIVNEFRPRHNSQPPRILDEIVITKPNL